MERDEPEGVDISRIDPELAEMLSIVPDVVIDYPTQSEGPPPPEEIAELAGNPHEGGIEDDEFDRTLGKPDELLKKIDPAKLPWVKKQGDEG